MQRPKVLTAFGWGRFGRGQCREGGGIMACHVALRLRSRSVQLAHVDEKGSDRLAGGILEASREVVLPRRQLQIEDD